ncbi:hypothetical protein CRV08_14675 [Halarcobacter ebronensis]|uniref:Prepilin-type cleavage/methylation domain-containing protein n=1 Tax=Halarcobacter ebronensis TaxID=1462615 RepID=A0A4Q0YAD1_9BACT|nr:type II secretion system protein [Halarcobacter ebronensis]RXJ65731.1 hypothetical protein CRV08_14675 [Halarcobacter ebronensis]
MKTALTLLEVIVVISLISIIYFTQSNKTFTNTDLEKAANRIVLYLKETRYQALIDDKRDENKPLWYKRRWTMKFFKCSESVGGIYYVIYSDENEKGHPNKDESLIDPLTRKRVYSSNSCESSNDTSKYVLLTKEFGIKNANISCNNTTSLGQISFGRDGKVYSKLSNSENSEDEYEILERCKIELISEKNHKIGIFIEPKTGFTYKE